MTISDIVFLAVAALFIVAAITAFVVARRSRAAEPVVRGNDAPRSATQLGDTYFRAMFPELNPHFHPEKVVRLVRDRNDRMNVADGSSWKYTAGFDVAEARVSLIKGRERIRLFDAAGVPVTEFDYEKQAAGGVLRVGRGKLTAVLDEQTNPRVRYWHPEREFKWSRKKGWQFTTPVAERSIDSDERGSRFSSDNSSSSSGFGTAAAAAGTAALVSGAGGAFAGGGASESWDAADGNATDGDASSGASAPAY